LRDAFFIAQGGNLKFPNLLWAISQVGNRYKFAAVIGHSESWLSRRLVGRVQFSPEERQTLAHALGYPAEWLFQEPQPPERVFAPDLAHAVA
jgi:DNA-binding transcriptional regulator YdaS (Cro superfamily)